MRYRIIIVQSACWGSDKPRTVAPSCGEWIRSNDNEGMLGNADASRDTVAREATRGGGGGEGEKKKEEAREGEGNRREREREEIPCMRSCNTLP
jgi:hypothetical protein